MAPSPVVSYDSLAELGLLYDHVAPYQTRRDVGFYVNETRDVDGTVLELASGTGRVLVPIARSGKRIVGLERSEKMLARCRENMAAESAHVRERIGLSAGDMRSFDLGERFDAVIIPFRPMQHLTTIDDQLACLESVRRHLAPGGRLIFDVFNPDLRRIATPPIDEFDDTPESPLPDGRTFRRTGRIVAARRLDQVTDVELIYYLTSPDGSVERRVHAIQMRWFLRAELEHLLARAGFEIAALYGDFDRSPLVDGSPEIIVIAVSS